MSYGDGGSAYLRRGQEGRTDQDRGAGLRLQIETGPCGSGQNSEGDPLPVKRMGCLGIAVTARSSDRHDWFRLGKVRFCAFGERLRRDQAGAGVILDGGDLDVEGAGGAI